MSPTFKSGRPPLLLKVLAHLGAVQVNEGQIEGAPNEHIHGLQEGKRVWVNPAYSTVGTLLHEVLHSLYPKWTESYVLGRETFLMNRLTAQEVQHLYELYLAKAKPRKRAKKA